MMWGSFTFNNTQPKWHSDEALHDENVFVLDIVMFNLKTICITPVPSCCNSFHISGKTFHYVGMWLWICSHLNTNSTEVRGLALSHQSNSSQRCSRRLLVFAWFRQFKHFHTKVNTRWTSLWALGHCHTQIEECSPIYIIIYIVVSCVSSAIIGTEKFAV